MFHKPLIPSLFCLGLLHLATTAQSREPTHRLDPGLSPATNGDFGRTCFALSDFDGDGFADYAVGAQHWPFPTAPGRVFLYSGRTATLIRTFDGDQPGSAFGLDVADLGDINGDGTRDLAVSAYDYDSGGFTNNGRVFAFSGTTGAVLWTSSGAASSRTLGKTLGAIWDITGDGIADLAASEPGYSVVTSGAGRVVYLSGASGVAVGSVDGSFQFEGLGQSLATRPGTGIVYAGVGASSKVYALPSVAVFGQVPVQAHAGVSGATLTARLAILLAAGSPSQLAVGRPNADTSGLVNNGTVTIYPVGSSLPTLVIEGTSTNEQVGHSLAASRDVDGDGAEEVVFTSTLPASTFAVRARVVSVSGTLIEDLTRSDGAGSIVESIPDVTDDGRGEWLLSTANGATGVFQICLFSKGLALTSTSSAGGGFTALFALDAGPSLGSRTYLQAYGVSGADPGTLGPSPWPLIPLNLDALTTLAFSLTGSSILPDAAGTLSSSGSGTTTLALPASVLPALAGISLTTAAVITDPAGTGVACATNPLTLVFP